MTNRLINTKKIQPKRAARYYYLRFIRLQGDPHTLARGVAVGLFIGVTPTIPLHTILILIFAYLLRGNTIASLISATVVSNPLTFAPQYYFSWLIGNWITPGNLSWDRIKETLDILTSDVGFIKCFDSLTHLGQEAFIVMLVGGCLLAAPITLVGYFLSFNFFKAIQNKRREKHMLK